MPTVQIQKEQIKGAEMPRKFRHVTAPVQPPTPKKPLPGRGRPCLLTKEREVILLKAIEEAMPLKQAAMLAGISYDSLNRWRIKGESDFAPAEFRDFCKALQRSEAVAMRSLLTLIHTAGQSDWKAAAWTLERRFPEEYSKPQRVEHSGPEGKPIEAMATVEPEVLRRMRKQAGMVELCGKLGAILLKNKAARNGEGQPEVLAKKPTRLRE
jgi:hypothetical protein